MAHSDKNIVITPNIGATSDDPKIIFSGADASTGPQNLTLKVYPTTSGTLSVDGSAGQLFSVTNSFTGTIFSVNDVSGVPNIEVQDTGMVNVAHYSGGLVVGGTTWDSASKLKVDGLASFNKGYREARVTVSGTVIDLSEGTYFTKTISSATTFTVSGVASSGAVSAFILDLTNGGSAVITWFSNLRWPGGTVPVLTASGRDILGFFTHDGGTNWNGLVLGKALA